ncbi:MAG: hypothetical protein U1F26_02960 [Lysobacterales bacterium]
MHTDLRATMLLLALGLASVHGRGEAAGWQLWASGLPGGLHPRLAIGPDHSIYYGVQATGGTRGIVHRANDALAPAGTFSALPPIPYLSITNNIQALTTNAASEPVVGIYHYYNGADPNGNLLHLNDPIAFVYDRSLNQWIAASVSVPAYVGVNAMARAPNGDLWFGGKWSRVYRSTDGGRSYTAIDESPLVQANAPCYYPTLIGNPSNGAIFSINVDARGWVYVGTEGAGVVYSDDQGVSWRPVDAYACAPGDPNVHNPASPMEPVTRTGNTGAIGFTRNNDLVWNGTELFAYPNWTSSVGYANLQAHTVAPALGFPDFFIARGVQVSRIVTSANGTLFLHSGANGSFDPNPPPPPLSSLYSMGIYRSDDGIHWTPFNQGISGINDGGAEGSLAVDGVRVFTATSDGKIWYYDDIPRILQDGFE